MELLRTVRETSKLLLLVAASLGFALIVVQTTARLAATPARGLTDIRDARSFDVV